ncbi:MAG: NAD(+)/NADH kinase, partial [Giesbergeria sp.]|nr:NAD(+)/NADH kinase [Giesbergeria sp.]
MKLHFRHVALIGKYQAPSSGTSVLGAQKVLEGIAQFLVNQGCTVSIEAQTAANTQLGQYAALATDQIGEQCDLGLVVGGDGTMLSIGRQLA